MTCTDIGKKKKKKKIKASSIAERNIVFVIDCNSILVGQK
jgi:hypothetical protein